MLGKNLDRPIRTTTILQTGNGLLAFRHHEWKLRYTKTPNTPDEKAKFVDSPVELYNLADDPYETTDLAAENPERIAEMKELLSSLLDRGRTR